MNAIEQLRAKLGMKSDELLRSGSGELADILDVTDDIVTLGVLSSGKQLRVHVGQLTKKEGA